MSEKGWQQVAYVFNAEHDSNIQDLVSSPYYVMPDIDILSAIKAQKATGPDDVRARLLKEATDQLAPIF